jgi:8-oxo-dGTP diphosphatase
MAAARRLSEIRWNDWVAKDQATLVFVVQDEQVLLIRKKRGLGAGKINGPGGKLEPGESAHDCAVREVREELGIVPKDLQRSGQNRFQFVDGYSIHVHVFLAQAFEGTPVETDEAVPHWFPLDAIPYEEMWEDDWIWLPLVFRREPFSGRFLFHGDTMQDWSLERGDVP